MAQFFTVVCPDLRGFGRSSQPADSPDHHNSSKRAKAGDCLELMKQFGFRTFDLVGHDRGAYTAFRCAMDHQAAIRRLVILDAVPILEALERTNADFARRWWHWFFFCTPDKPERAICADPLQWYKASPAIMGEENYRDFVEAVADPAVVHGMVEDYRAGPGVDAKHDADDRRADRRLKCPTLVLWAANDDLGEIYGDVTQIWEPWADDLPGDSFPSGHHMAEEEPELLAGALLDFLT